jgi:hypothetical protein
LILILIGSFSGLQTMLSETLAAVVVFCTRATVITATASWFLFKYLTQVTLVYLAASK